MVFSSLIFLYAFLPLVLILYKLPKTIRGKNVVLFIASMFFYAWGEPVWIFQMLISGTSVYVFALLVDKYSSDKKKAFFFLILGIISALVPLAIFKYSSFLIKNFNVLTGYNLTLPKFKMPIGISFYTFQIISYIVDLHRGECTVQKNIFKFWLYEALFPQLIAGPIVRYSDVESEINSRTVSPADEAYGITRFAVGLSKKVLLANYAGNIVSKTIAPDVLNDATALSSAIGLLAWSFQIYFDFSGYSDMAIGLGRIFGFHFKENFNYPYISSSVTEFWRRWHISLGTFFRDYVYIPLGGNQKNQAFNIFAVWFLTGLWHGADWNFILWGLFFAFFLVLEKYFLKKLFSNLPRFIRLFYTLTVIYLSWAIFYYTDLSDLCLFFTKLFALNKTEVLDFESRMFLEQNLFFFMLAAFASTPAAFNFAMRLFKKTSYNRVFTTFNAVTVIFAIILCTASLVGDSFNPFLYFRF